MSGPARPRRAAAREVRGPGESHGTDRAARPLATVPILGASAFTAYDGSIEAFFDLLAQHGLRHVELRNFIGDDDAVDPRAADRVAVALRQAGFTSSIHAPWRRNLASGSDRDRELALANYTHAIDMAATFGSRVVVFHGGWHENPVEGHARCRDAIDELLDHARGTGVLLALENDEVSRPTLFRHPADFEGYGQRDLRFTLDVAHGHTLGHAPSEFVAVMGDRIAAIHLHDNDGSADQHLAIGAGTVDWQRALETLAPYREAVTVIEAKSVERLAASVAALREMLRAP